MKPRNPEDPGGESDRTTYNRHFLRDLEGLWGEILKMAAVVEVTLNTSVRALCEGRADLAAQVKGDEKAIDRWEVQIEQECVKILALYQPVASDLRRVAAVLKINNDLERMADLADHVAGRVKKLTREPQPVPIPPALEVMAKEAMTQVRDVLEALAKSDATMARAVITGDRQVNRHRRAVLAELKQGIRNDPDRVSTWLRLINTARNLERISDHATNIAETVIYMKEGDIVRHVGRPVPSA